MRGFKSDLGVHIKRSMRGESESGADGKAEQTALSAWLIRACWGLIRRHAAVVLAVDQDFFATADSVC